MLNKIILMIGLAGINNIATAAPDKVAYELQERCGKATRAEFIKSWGDSGMVTSKATSMSADFKNHYNSKLNKCFYLLSSSVLNNNIPNALPVESITLIDFNESNTLGEYRTQGARKHCEFKGVDCKSQEGFELLIKPFMEE